MIREEAFARVSTLLRKRGEGLDSSHRYAGASIAALEALGLIEFEDEAQDEITAEALRGLQGILAEIRSPPSLCKDPDYHATIAGRLTMHGAGCVIDALRLGGFKVVRA